jgi:hypothetical protein
VDGAADVGVAAALARPKPGNRRSDFQVAVARRVVERLPDHGVVGVLLSGSSTWADADASSDVDLQVLLDRPPPYREVTCLRIADLLGEALPDGPHYVDVDRISAAGYREVTVERGGWHHRVVHGLILRDTGDFLATLQREVVARFVRPAAYRARFEQFRSDAEAERAGARAAAARGDAPLARLRARLMATHAAAALLDLADDRVSNHLVDAVVKAVGLLGRPALGRPLLRALAVDGGAAGVDGTLGAWRRFGEVALAWLDDPAVGGRLNGEDRAWVRFNWSDAVVEEMTLRRAALTRLGKLPALQYYADGKLTVAVRITFGKCLSLIETGQAARQDLVEFHHALRRLRPDLFGEWLAGLRLDAPGPALAECEALADDLLATGEAALGRVGA